MGNSFENLETTQFNRRMRPDAVKIYESIWPGSKTHDLTAVGANDPHALDKSLGIDCVVTLPSGCEYTIQEKFRKHEYLVNKKLRTSPRCPDFTQEVENATGTIYAGPGEYFKLAAMFYFFGWSNREETAFEKWVMVSVPEYKMIIESLGGISKVGILYRNGKHGRASFRAFPIDILDSATRWRSENYPKGQLTFFHEESKVKHCEQFNGSSDMFR